MEIVNLIKYAFNAYAQTIVYIILDPIVWIFGVIIFNKYNSTIAMQRSIYGNKLRYSRSELISTSLLWSIVAGLIGTIIITLCGVTFHKFQGLQFIIILSLLLMSVNPRYVCLSYAGGMLSVFTLIVNDLVKYGYLSSQNTFISFVTKNINFDVTSLIALIAIMHLLEGFLIWIDGKKGVTPVYIKKGGEIVGAFVMQRFWIIPIIFYILLLQPGNISSTVATPTWWPLVKPSIDANTLKTAVFQMVPFMAIIGYGDFAVSSSVDKKVKKSAKTLFLFSIVLFILTFLSSKYYMFKYIAAFFAPVAHEMMIVLERYEEGSGEAIFRSSDKGVIVLDTIKDGFADQMGIKTGDIVLKINNNNVYSLKDINEIVSSAYTSFLWIDILNSKNEQKSLEGRIKGDNESGFGVITVPRMDEINALIEAKEGKLESKMREIFKKNK